MRVENEAFHSIVNIPVAVPQWGSAKGKQGQYNAGSFCSPLLSVYSWQIMVLV